MKLLFLNSDENVVSRRNMRALISCCIGNVKSFVAKFAIFCFCHVLNLRVSQVVSFEPTVLHVVKCALMDKSNFRSVRCRFFRHSCWLDDLLSCRNHSKPHLRPTIPTADRSTGLLDNPGLFPSFPSERLNGVRSSPPTRLPTSQPRTRLPSTSAFPRRDTVGTGRVTEPTTTDYSLGVNRGRYGTDPTHKGCRVCDTTPSWQNKSGKFVKVWQKFTVIQEMVNYSATVV